MRLAARRRLLVWFWPIHRLFRTPTFRGRPPPLPCSVNSAQPFREREQTHPEWLAVKRVTDFDAQCIAVANGTRKAVMSVLRSCCIEGGRRHGLRSAG